MDVLKLALPQESVRCSVGIGRGVETGPSGATVNYPSISTKASSNTPRKRTMTKLPVIIETPAAANQVANTSWKSTSTATPPTPDAKSKSNILKRNTPSPKRMRKRYLMGV